MGSMRLNLSKKKVLLISFLVIGIVISVVIFFPMVEEEPYFITIKNNEDLEFWSSSGNGTIENPYSIEGHHITVPRNDPDDFDVPCFPEYSVISIRNITKSFIIQNNIIEVKGGCEDNQQYIISMADISVPFTIRNNYLRGAGCFKLLNVNGFNSTISNNKIYYAGSSISNSHNINFIHNQFTYSYSLYIYQCSNLSYIQNHFYLTSVGIRECSRIILHDNIFENDDIYSGWTRLTVLETGHCTITDNSLIRAGLDLRSFYDYYPTAIISGNLVNGKPYGYFYNQSDVMINSNTQYGQINLVKCNFSIVTDQIISHTSYSIHVKYCTNTIIANSTFSHCGQAGVYIKYSSKTHVLDCILEDNHSGVRGENSPSIFVKRNLFRSLIFGVYLETCSLQEEDNVFEDVDFQIRIFP